MTQPHNLFEVSFEVCNKVGGIYTVLSTKARTLTARYGDDYVCIGPWLIHDAEERPMPFVEEPGFEGFEEACREMGLPVRVGRWTVPGEPRTILVEFSSLYEKKNDLLAELWEQYEVDSIAGDWDYVEPVLFGIAAGRVIEAYWEEYLAPRRRRAVAQFHEWMTGAGLLHLAHTTASVGTVFTTHATMLGRALSSLGRSPADGLGGETSEDLARQHGVTAKHSMEGTCARVADVFTTVSEITAAEAELLHGRAPAPVLPNGIDLTAVDALAGDAGRDEVRARLVRLAESFLGEDLGDASLVATSGRYEFHNKGLDVLLDACARTNERPGRRAVVFFLVPAGNSGLRAELREREGRPVSELDGPLGLSTHNLFDAANDPIQRRCAELSLENAPGSRVRVVQVPVYLDSHDDFLGLPYEAVVRAMDATVFPSFYEPWGYTPQESLALGVPTVTTDFAGFGLWAEGEGLGPADGVTVLPRTKRTYDQVVDELADELDRLFAGDGLPAAETCRETARRTEWSGLIARATTRPSAPPSPRSRSGWCVACRCAAARAGPSPRRTRAPPRGCSASRSRRRCRRSWVPCSASRATGPGAGTPRGATSSRACPPTRGGRATTTPSCSCAAWPRPTSRRARATPTTWPRSSAWRPGWTTTCARSPSLRASSGWTPARRSAPSPTCRRSSRCTSRCASTPAGSASSPATT